MTGALLVAAASGFAAGVQNALAGGGSFVTFPALLWGGLDARAANITSTVALFPGQVATGLAGRRWVGGLPSLPFRWLAGISLAGGSLGALLLLATPSSVFESMVPWLILFATAVFAYGSFRRVPVASNRVASNRAASNRGAVNRQVGRLRPAATQMLISIYGGYFGGGIGFLMLAVLTLAGQDVRRAGATKNVLAGVMNASAVVIFAFSRDVAWGRAAALGAAAIAGGQAGAWLLTRVNPHALRIAIVAIGCALTVAMFWRNA